MKHNISFLQKISFSQILFSEEQQMDLKRNNKNKNSNRIRREMINVSKMVNVNKKDRKMSHFNEETADNVEK